MSTDYTLPPLPDHPFTRWQNREKFAIEEFGQQCAEAARAPLMARIAELEAELAQAQKPKVHVGIIGHIGNDKRTLAAAIARVAAPPSQPVYRCDFCGSDYTDQTLCCEKRREYLAAAR